MSNNNSNKNIILDKVGAPDSRKKDTASLFLIALLLICITTGLVRGIKMEPRNKKPKTSLSRSLPPVS